MKRRPHTVIIELALVKYGLMTSEVVCFIECFTDWHSDRETKISICSFIYFRPLSAQTWPQDPVRRARLDK